MKNFDEIVKLLDLNSDPNMALNLKAVKGVTIPVPLGYMALIAGALDVFMVENADNHMTKVLKLAMEDIESEVDKLDNR